MSTILGNAITFGGGGASLNIDYSSTPPTDTTKLWVPLEKKPDAVECSPVLNYGGNTIETLQAQIPTLQKYRPAIIVRGDYMYAVGGGNTAATSYAKNTITKINLKNGVQQTLSATLPDSRTSMFYAEVNGKLYILGGCSASSSSSTNTVYIFDPSTETVTTGTPLSTTMKTQDNYGANSVAVIGNRIYIMGFLTYNSSGLSNHYNILYYDVETGNTINTGVNSTTNLSCCASVGNMIYCVGGITTGNQGNQGWYKFDTLTNTVSSIKSQNTFVYSAVASVGKYVYIFTGYSAGYYNNIYRIDSDTDIVEKLSITTSQKVALRNVCVSGLDIYITSGGNPYQNTWIQSIDKFSTNSPLTNNHLLLQEDFGTDSLWSAIKSKDTDLKVKVINAYIGDSNNIAQLTDAYLYDSGSSTWKSLDGVSMTADMLNALATLGVN